MFNTFKKVLGNEKINNDELNKINPFIFKRWLSNNVDGLMFGSFINSYDLDNYTLYEYFRVALSKKNIKFIPYPKSSKKSEDIEFIARHYKTNFKNAEEIIEILTKEQLHYIKSGYGGKE